MNKPLLACISACALERLVDFSAAALPRSELVALSLGLLGIAWAHAYLAVEDPQFLDHVRRVLIGISLEVDRIDSATSGLQMDALELDACAVCGVTAQSPWIQMDLQGMIVIHKTPNWEVDGKARANAAGAMSDDAPPALSSWLRSVLPQGRCPLTRNSNHDYGFLHRLDVPSSGLILCGTTYAGYTSLRLQLDTYQVERQYLVFGHGLASPAFREVVVKIDPSTIDSRRSFVSDVHGKPATSWFTVPGHCTGHRKHAFDWKSFSVFVVRIRTGRRHQIRAHMLYSGHPTVVDAKYSVTSVLV